MSVVLWRLPAFMVVGGGWTLVADGRNLAVRLGGTRPRPVFRGQVFFLSLLPLGVVMGPLLLRGQAWAAASPGPKRAGEAVQAGQLAESRSQAVDVSRPNCAGSKWDLDEAA